jgi:hypothetical protein
VAGDDEIDVPPHDWEELPSYNRIVVWRCGVLTTAGIPYDDALRMAQDRNVDVYYAAAMVRFRGCPVDLVAKILL